MDVGLCSPVLFRVQAVVGVDAGVAESGGPIPDLSKFAFIGRFPERSPDLLVLASPVCGSLAFFQVAASIVEGCVISAANGAAKRAFVLGLAELPGGGQKVSPLKGLSRLGAQK